MSDAFKPKNKVYTGLYNLGNVYGKSKSLQTGLTHSTGLFYEGVQINACELL